MRHFLRKATSGDVPKSFGPVVAIEQAFTGSARSIRALCGC